MSEYLSFKEKVELLAKTSRMNIENVRSRVETGVVEDDYDKNRIRVHRDVRAELDEAIKESGLPQTAVMRALGVPQVQGFNNYLHGRRALPNDLMEELLWLLDGKVRREE